MVIVKCIWCTNEPQPSVSPLHLCHDGRSEGVVGREVDFASDERSHKVPEKLSGQGLVQLGMDPFTASQLGAVAAAASTTRPITAVIVEDGAKVVLANDKLARITTQKH